MNDPLYYLNRYFGYSSFRPSQLEIINSIIRKNDTLVILPTGAGKSLCYQIPALMIEGTAIIISPLISLMKDQVEQIKNKMEADFINSSLPFFEQEKIIKKAKQEKVKLLYVSPEKFVSENFQNELNQIKISFFAIDEAHCISEWGHNFRPSYLKLKDIIKNYPDKITAAFTATATPEVKEDIIANLKLNNPRIFISGFYRDNLNISIIKKSKIEKTFIDTIKRIDGSKIIYCQSRKDVENINELMRKNQIQSLPYHAGMSIQERKITQDFFSTNKCKVIVATNAFGMGINKPDVRAVIHYNMPGSIESYYQEIGRAGRDGEKSEAILFYKSEKDRRIHEYFINASLVERDLIVNFYEKLHNVYKIERYKVNSNIYPTDQQELQKILNFSISQNQLNSILSLFERYQLIKTNDQINEHLNIRIDVSYQDIKDDINYMDEGKSTLIELMFRKYGSIANKKFNKYSINDFSETLEISKKDLIRTLKDLRSSGIVSFKEELPKDTFIFLKERVPAELLPFDYEEIKKVSLNTLKKLHLMDKYIHLKSCRWNYILKYFGENDDENFKCGKCDNCLGMREKDIHPEIDIKKEILITVKQLGGKFGINTISDILMGSKSKKIIESNLNKVMNYGYLSGVKKELIKETINKLIYEDFLTKSDSLYPTIDLTEKGKELVKDNIVEILDLVSHPKLVSKERTSDQIDLNKSITLFDKLLQTRKFLSQKFNQPEFMICSDSILQEISITKPRSLDELSSVNGVSKKFVLKCGDSIIEEINNFLRFGNADEYKKVDSLPQNIKVTYNMIKDGYSLVEICEKRNQAEEIISEHIENLINNDLIINLNGIIPDSVIKDIEKAVTRSKSKFIPEIKRQLPKHISFSEIRIVLTYLNKHKILNSE